MDIWYGPKVVIENVHRWFSLISIDVIMVQMFIFVLTTLIDAINLFVNTRRYFSISTNRYIPNYSLLYIIRISIWYSIIISLLLHQNLLLLQIIIHDQVFWWCINIYDFVTHILQKSKYQSHKEFPFLCFILLIHDSCQKNLVNCTLNIGKNFSSFP